MPTTSADPQRGPGHPGAASPGTPVAGFQGNVALVTGGTSGIGKAAALAFARRGANVLVAGRDTQRGKDVCRACRDAGTQAEFFAVDVRRRNGVAAMVDFALATFGRLDIAFNNAGYQEPRAVLADQTDHAYDTVFDSNVRSLFLAMRAEIAVMVKQGGGVIVNNASVSGVRNANPGLALYSASKAAAISLTRSAAMEYAPAGIRINSISPGRVVTPMMLASKIADMGAVAAGLPLRRMGQPEEVAEAVVWLASDSASYIVGHNLCADGGFLAQ